MRIKHDVELRGIQPEMAMGAIVIESVYKFYGQVLEVTSCREGVHMTGSLHYKGYALDCSWPNAKQLMAVYSIPVDGLVNLLRDALGPQFDVVPEPDKNHIHVEFQPKTPPPPPHVA